MQEGENWSLLLEVHLKVVGRECRERPFGILSRMLKDRPNQTQEEHRSKDKTTPRIDCIN